MFPTFARQLPRCSLKTLGLRRRGHRRQVAGSGGGPLNRNPPRKSALALAVHFPETLFPQTKRCFSDPGGWAQQQAGVWAGPGPSIISPRASCLWWAPHGAQESAEMSKYWSRPQVSGCRKGNEKVWARETRGRTHGRNTVTAATAQLDRRAIAARARGGRSPWSRRRRRPVSGAPSAFAATPQSRLDNSRQRFRKCLRVLLGC